MCVADHSVSREDELVRLDPTLVEPALETVGTERLLVGGKVR